MKLWFQGTIGKVGFFTVSSKNEASTSVYRGMSQNHVWLHGSWYDEPKLVGGFNPFEKYESNWTTSPNRGENKHIWNHHLGNVRQTKNWSQKLLPRRQRSVKPLWLFHTSSFRRSPPCNLLRPPTSSPIHGTWQISNPSFVKIVFSPSKLWKCGDVEHFWAQFLLIVTTCSLPRQ